VATLKREMESGPGSEELRIQNGDWEVALGKVRASVKDAGKYRRLKERGM